MRMMSSRVTLNLHFYGGCSVWWCNVDCETHRLHVHCVGFSCSSGCRVLINGLTSGNNFVVYCKTIFQLNIVTSLPGLKYYNKVTKFLHL